MKNDDHNSSVYGSQEVDESPNELGNDTQPYSSGNTSAEASAGPSYLDYSSVKSSQDTFRGIRFEQTWSTQLPAEDHVKKDVVVMQEAISHYLNERMTHKILKSPYTLESISTLSHQVQAYYQKKKRFETDRQLILSRLYEKAMISQKASVLWSLMNERISKILTDTSMDDASQSSNDESLQSTSTSMGQLCAQEDTFAREISAIKKKYDVPMLFSNDSYTVHGSLEKDISINNLNLTVDTNTSIFTYLHDILRPAAQAHSVQTATTSSLSFTDSSVDDSFKQLGSASKILPKKSIITLDYSYIHSGVENHLISLIG